MADPEDSEISERNDNDENRDSNDVEKVSVTDQSTAATLQKTILEIEKIKKELEINLSKSKLEISKLQREISIGRIPEIFLDKWVPTLVASVLLFTAIPLANDAFWKSQKHIDLEISTINKMRETYSKLALATTQFLQTIDRIDELQCKDDPLKLSLIHI